MNGADAAAASGSEEPGDGASSANATGMGQPWPETRSGGRPVQVDMVEFLAGDLALRYGAVPVVALPQEDELLIGFVMAMGFHLAGKGLYRRDRLIVLPESQKHRLIELSAEAFVSWSQHWVVTCKHRYDKNGERYPAYKDMPTSVAKQVIEGNDFVEAMEEIEELHPVPMPRLNADGTLDLLEPGFDGGIFTFEV